MAKNDTTADDLTIRQSAESIMQFMLTGQTYMLLTDEHIHKTIEKAFDISKAFHAFDHTAKSGK